MSTLFHQALEEKKDAALAALAVLEDAERREAEAGVVSFKGPKWAQETRRLRREQAAAAFRMQVRTSLDRASACLLWDKQLNKCASHRCISLFMFWR